MLLAAAFKILLHVLIVMFLTQAPAESYRPEDVYYDNSFHQENLSV